MCFIPDSHRFSRRPTSFWAKLPKHGSLPHLRQLVPLEAGKYEKIPHIFVPTSDLRDLRILCGLLTCFQHQNPWGLWKKWSEFPSPQANLRDSNLCRWQKVSENKWLLVRFPSTEHTGWCIDGYTKNRTPPLLQSKVIILTAAHGSD